MANCSRLIVCATNDFPNLRYSKDENGSPYPPTVEASLSYEARNCIPFFWLCLFEGKHLRRVLLPDEENSIAGYAVPALFASRQDVTKNLLRRSPLLKQILPASVLALYEDFADKVKKEEGPFFLVIAEEIARMREEGRYADAIANALWVMETLPPEEWAKDFDFSTIAGLDQKIPPANSEGHILVGHDKTAHLTDEHAENIQESQESARAVIQSEEEDLHTRAREGGAEAWCALGFALLEGQGVEKNEALAFEWFSKAAEEGYPEAQYMVGKLHVIGKEIPKNLEEAVTWLHKAAEQGHPKAQDKLGLFHEAGFGVEADWREAVHWYSKAANQGSLPAKLNLASLTAYNEDSETHRAVIRDILLSAEGFASNGIEKDMALPDQSETRSPTVPVFAPEDSGEDSRVSSLLQAVREAAADSVKPLDIIEHTVQHSLVAWPIVLFFMLLFASPIIGEVLEKPLWLLIVMISFCIFPVKEMVANDFCINAKKQSILWRHAQRRFPQVAPSDFQIKAGHDSAKVLYCPPKTKHAVLGKFTGPGAVVAAKRLREALMALVSYRPPSC